MSLSTFKQSICANANCEHQSKHSEEPLSIVCRSCHLVTYCSRACQLQHSVKHDLECKSPLSRPDWKPNWQLERRDPAFVGEGGFQESHGVQKFLWGNIPAIDICRLQGNEDLEELKDLRLLFAASGDLRNVIKSVVGLPKDFSKHCEIFVNDKDDDIVARNIIVLLATRCLEPNTVPEAVVHIWYSALLPTSVFRSLQERVLPLVQDVYNKIKGKGDDLLLSKTWNFATCTLRVVLKKAQWNHVLQCLQVPDGLSVVQALNVRKAITLAPHRIDYLHRSYCSQPSGWRAARQKFREDGLLLPFGASRMEFTTPNPTFFPTRSTWPMMDSADPLNTWPMEEVIKKAGPAENDIYGGLHKYVADILEQFCTRLATVEIKFHMTEVDALALEKTLDLSGKPESSFDRIEVSNVIDHCHLGPERTLATFSRLLRPVDLNPRATLITLFLNAVQEADMDEPAMENITNRTLQAARYIYRPGLRRPGDYMYTKENVNGMSALVHFMDFEGLFEKYTKGVKLLDIGKKHGLKPKLTNTIVDVWPYRLRQHASQKEFDALFASNLTGCERYMEWVRDGSSKT